MKSTQLFGVIAALFVFAVTAILLRPTTPPPQLSDSRFSQLGLATFAKLAYAAVGDAKFAGSYATFSGTLRGTQFIDNDNSAYFLDPNATGTSASIAGSINFKGKLLENGVEIFSGMIAAFANACPTGWTEYTAAAGRTVVGTPNGGTNAGTIGTAFTNLENRTHTHTIAAHNHLEGFGLGSGAAQGVQGGLYGTSGTFTSDMYFLTYNGSFTSTNFLTSTAPAQTSSTASTSNVIPYIQLTYCQKSAGSDIAEWIAASENASAATIVSVDPNTNEKIIASRNAYDQSVVGIISTKPGWTIGDQKTGSYQIALSGRVSTKVSLVNGEIKRGDPITTSSISGVGMKATSAGPIVGKAMEPLNGRSTLIDCANPSTGKVEKCGVITVFVNISWYDPDLTLTSAGDLTMTKDQSETYQVTDAKNNNSVIIRIGAFAEMVVGKIRAGIIETKKLILDGIDVAAKLKELSDKIDNQQKINDRQDQIIQELQAETQLLKTKQ